jgi:AraC-like DNA-binding protein/mannose-6-phosphate isomerase-like protein (cupin superfamily)
MLTKVYKKGWTDDSTWIIHAPSKIERESLFYVQEIGLFHCLPDYYTLHENIASFLIFYIVSGECEFTYRKKKHTLKKDELIFVDCKEYHTLQLKKNKKCDALWVQFNGNNVYAYYNEFIKQKKAILNTGEDRYIYTALNKMLELNCKKNAYCELLNSKYLTDILTKLMMLSKAVPGSVSSLPEYIRIAISDIEAHFMDDLSLDYFAKLTSTSKYHFLKEFKKYIGSTPYSYIQMVRMDNAKRLLKYSDTSISVIAEEIGFRNINNFFYSFKKKIGMTPQQFRRFQDSM